MTETPASPDTPQEQPVEDAPAALHDEPTDPDAVGDPVGGDVDPYANEDAPEPEAAVLDGPQVPEDGQPDEEQQP